METSPDESAPARTPGLLGQVLFLLSRREKRRGAVVLALVVVMAALETAGVASVAPFLSVLGDPATIETNPALSRLHSWVGAPPQDTFLMMLGAGAFCVIVTAAAVRLVTDYALNHFIEMRRHSISERLLETYLRQPYSFFVTRHSTDLARTILSEVDQLITNVFFPGTFMVAYAVVLAAFVVLLIVVAPGLGVVAVGCLGGAYGIVYLVVRRRLSRVGDERRRANHARFRMAGEALAGIKEIKLLGREHAYLSRFHTPSARQARSQAVNRTLSETPRFLVEAVALGGMIVLAVTVLAIHGSDRLGTVLPLLGLYAFAGMRMLPAAQRVYQGAAKLRFGAPAVNGVYHDLRQRIATAELRREAPAPLAPQHTLALDRVSYHYPEATAPALTEMSLTIPAGSSLAIVGQTGAGKTTLVDVLLGLLRPTAGTLRVDDRPITKARLAAYQAALGYVPQQVFLTDASVAENIAFGRPPGAIDMAWVQTCARLAQLDTTISQELPDGYATVLGESGTRLSGGQRQRLAIARALYHDPAVLVLDEATNALDPATEAAVLDSIVALQGRKTVILIAHDERIARRCDRIATLEAGRLASLSETSAA